MNPDTSTAFGHYRPTGVLGSLIAAAQAAPHNWIGHQAAQFIRKLVLKLGRLPLDLSVEQIRMRCYLRDNYSEKKFVFTPWRFDRLERRAMLEELSPDGVFVDIGANVGIYTLTAATRLGPSGRILALEPNPAAHRRLCFNVEATLGGRSVRPKIDALRVGAGGTRGVFDLHLDPKNLGGSSLLPTADSPGHAREHSVRIPCIPLLDLLELQKIHGIDVLKIDIEGAEDEVLVPFLHRAQPTQLPRLIILENSAHRWTQDLPGALARRGYTRQLQTRMNSVYRRTAMIPGASA